MFLVIGLRRRALQAHAVQIPLGIRIVSDVVQGFEIVLGVHGGSPSGNGVETPMDKYSKLRVGVPLRKRMAIERLDGRIIMRGSLRGDRRKDKERREYEQNASEFPVETRKRHLAVPQYFVRRKD